MRYLLLFINILLFILSSIGYSFLLKKLFNVKSSYIPSLVVAFQVVILFFFSIIGLLVFITYTLFILGLGFFLFFAIKKRNFDIEILKQYFVILVILFVVLVIVKGKTFIHYDNFSHWAVVTKLLFKKNRIPELNDLDIAFPSYPLGSSLFIYYFCYFIGHNDSIQMTSQAYMMIVCFLPLISLSKKIWNKILIFFMINLLLIYNIMLVDLLVDTILPIVASCTILFIRNHDNKNGILSLFYLIEIVQIKTPGIFYLFIISIYYIYKSIKSKSLIYTIPILSSLLSLFVWKISVYYRFGEHKLGKFSLSADNLLDHFLENSSEIQIILHNMMNRFICFSYILYFLLFFISSIIVALIMSKNKINCLKYFSFVLAIFILYIFGMFLMYLFTMPKIEAIQLGGFDRYLKSIIIACLYLTFSIIMVQFANIKITSFSNASVFVIFSLALFIYYLSVTNNRIVFLLDKEYSSKAEEKYWIEDIKSKYGLLSNDTYYIAIHSEDAGYFYFLGRYVLDTVDCYEIIVDDVSKLDKLNTHYLLIYDKNSIINDWVRINYPEQYGNEVIEFEWYKSVYLNVIK